MVSTLDQRISITCPLPQAEMRLRHYFKEHRTAGAETASISLGVHVDVAGLPPVALERTIVATVDVARHPADMTPHYGVHWAPEFPGPFPDFAGELVVDGGADFDTFVLRLFGTYTPPLGVVGKGFDLAVGNRIAQATAHDLLGRIKHAIEREFFADEARKPPRDPHVVSP